MQVPRRKAVQYTFMKLDPFITAKKLVELKADLEKLKNYVHPKLADEVKRLALMGDFSENTAYQMAKGRLRGINEKILQIQKQIDSAEIIQADENSQTVQIGNLITLEINKQIKKYRILGSLETNPSAGVISYNSPLGQALLNKKVGDIVPIKLEDKNAEYTIIAIG